MKRATHSVVKKGVELAIKIALPEVHATDSDDDDKKDFHKTIVYLWSGAILMIGGEVFFASKNALVKAFHLPVSAAKTCLTTAGNTGIIAYDSCKIACLLSKRVVCQVVEVGGCTYAVPCNENIPEITDETDLSASLRSSCRFFSESNVIERIDDDWVVVEQKNKNC